MLAWQKLFRAGNLLYMALLLLLLRYCIIVPLYDRLGFESCLSAGMYLVLVLSVLCIAAAGYAINDYFDIDTDSFNKPERVVVGKIIAPQTLINVYIALNIVGIALSAWVGWQCVSYKLGFIHLLTAFLLWQYSYSWQRVPLWGNMVIAGLGCVLVLIPALFETELLYYAKDALAGAAVRALGYDESALTQSPEAAASGFSPTIWQYILPYALFAFLLTLAREIVKDIEDYDGDRRTNYRTLPIVVGIGGARLAALIPLLLAVQFIVQFQLRQLLYANFVAIVGALVLVLLPLLFLVWKLWQAQSEQDFGQISRQLKWLTCAGLLYLPYLAVQLDKMPIKPIQKIELPQEAAPDEQIIDFKIDTIVKTGEVE